ncbi:hypothetical protein D3C83_308000 [compost metagenome]
MLVVIETALPSMSTIEMWLVEKPWSPSSGAMAASLSAGEPGAAIPMLRAGSISSERSVR